FHFSDLLAIKIYRYMGGIDLVANPPGVTVYLDGKKVGKMEEGERGNKKLSKVFQIRGLTSGDHSVKVSHARAVPQDKTINVVVEKGKISRPAQINMWIADSVVKFKNGKEVTGRIVENDASGILFEPEPGIAIRYKANEISGITHLGVDE
ncbi:MAG TPA: hypothetical protein PK821_08010, partial [Victivallales bacterium]|nr:hypothetical protein [Victivallales bacterium]